jgi:RNA polymerase sigma-70 factor, ECF subfamily
VDLAAFLSQQARLTAAGRLAAALNGKRRALGTLLEVEMADTEPENTDPGRGDKELQDEFLLLFSQYSRRIYAFVLTLLPNYADADEVFQNTCVVLWRKFAEYNREGSFIAWACRIAYLEMLDLHNRGKRMLPFDNATMERLVEEMAARTNRSAAREDALRGCLQNLSPSDRALIEQRYYHQRPPKVIALESSRSIHAIYRALARVHTQLRECIERLLWKELAP